MFHARFTACLADKSPGNIFCSSCATMCSNDQISTIKITDLPQPELLNPLNPHPQHCLTTSGLLLHRPVEEDGALSLCASCVDYLQYGRSPELALAHGFWIGQPPDVLRRLNLLETILITKQFFTAHSISIHSDNKSHVSIRINIIPLTRPCNFRTLPLSTTALKKIVQIRFNSSNDEPMPDMPNFKVQKKKIFTALNWLQRYNTVLLSPPQIPAGLKGFLGIPEDS